MNDIPSGRGPEDGQPERFGQASNVGRDYVARASVANVFELEAGRLAMTRAERPEILDIARRMLDDHTTTGGLLLRAAMQTRGGVEVLREIDGPHRRLMNRLRQERGAGFERTYLAIETAHHAETLSLHRAYAATGEEPELRTAAAEIAAVTEDHLSRLRTLSGAAADR